MSLTITDNLTPKLNQLLREIREARREQERLQAAENAAARRRETDQQVMAAMFWGKPLAKLLAELRKLKPRLFMFPPHPVPVPWMKVEASVYADDLLLLLFTSGNVNAYRSVPPTVYAELLKSPDPYKYYLGHLFGRYLGGRVR